MTDISFPYRVTEILHKGDRITLYRAVRASDRVPVILKVLDPRRSRPRDLAQLKNEYAVGSALDTDAVVAPLSLEIERETPTLVLADFGGEPLSRQIGAAMELDRFLRSRCASPRRSPSSITGRSSTRISNRRISWSTRKPPRSGSRTSGSHRACLARRSPHARRS